MSGAHAQAAEAAAEYALTEGRNALEERVRALREVGRALALDPQQPVARRALSRLLAEPPDNLPEENFADEELEDEKRRRRNAKLHARWQLSFLITLPLVLWMGVNSWTAVAAYGFFSAVSAVVFWLLERGKLQGKTGLFASVISSSLSISTMSAMFGPLFVVPGLAAANTIANTMYVSKRSIRVVVTLIGVLAVLLPLILAATGVLPHFYAFRDDGLVILPRMHNFNHAAVITFLCYIAFGHIAAMAVIVGGFRDDLRKAERKLQINTWQFEQLISEEARGREVSPTSRK